MAFYWRMTTLTAPPTRFAAGSTVSFRIAATTALDGTALAADDGWALLWVLRGAGEANAASVAAGSGWLVTLSAAASGQLGAGVYRTALRFTQGTGPAQLVHSLCGQALQVTPDLFDAVAGDLADPDERALTLLIAARDGTLAQGFQSVMVDGKQLTHYSLDQIDRAITRYEVKLARKRGGGLSGHIGITFVRR